MLLSWQHSLTRREEEDKSSLQSILVDCTIQYLSQTIAAAPRQQWGIFLAEMG